MTEVTVNIAPVEHPVTVNIDEAVTNVVVSVTEQVTEVSVFVGPDATAVIQNSQGTTIITEQIPSGVTEVITLADLTYSVTVNGTLAGSGSVPVYGDADIVINL